MSRCSTPEGFVTTFEASVMLGRARDYNFVKRLAQRGQIRLIEWSPRIYLYPRADIERMAARLARKLEAA